MSHLTFRKAALPTLLFGASALVAWSWPFAGDRNPLPAGGSAGRGEMQLPTGKDPKVQRSALKGRELISQLSAGFSGTEKLDQQQCIDLLLALDAQLRTDPENTWREIMSGGTKAKMFQGYAANRIGQFHGAALMGAGSIPDVYRELPSGAFLSGCARRADFAAEIQSVMAWNPRRGSGRFPGKADALRELAKQWAKANGTSDFPWPSADFAPHFRKLASSGAEAGLAENGVAGRIATVLTLNDLASKGDAQLQFVADGVLDNWPAPSRTALQLLEKTGDPIMALEVAKKSGASHLTAEIIALGIAMDTVPLEKIFKWAQSSPESMLQVASIVGGLAPSEGLKWLQTLDPKSPQTKQVAGKLLNAWAMAKPEEAAQACLSNKLFAGLTIDTYGGVLKNLGSKNASQTVRLLESIGPGANVPPDFRSALIAEISRNQPEYFQKQVMAGGESGLSDNELAMWVSHLTVKQGRDGAQWALANTSGISQEEVAGAVIRGLALKNPADASSFANTLEPGPARDGAAAALVALTVNSEPVSAFEWAVSISEPSRRGSALLSSLRSLEKAGVPLDPYLTRAGFTQWPPVPTKP